MAKKRTETTRERERERERNGGMIERQRWGEREQLEREKGE